MTLFFVASAWLCGAIVGAAGFGQWWPVIALAGAAALTVLAHSHGLRTVFLGGLLLLTGLASLAHYEAALPPEAPGGIAVYNDGGPVRLAGTIVSAPEQRETAQRFVVEVEGVETGGQWHREGGRLLVFARPFPVFRYGDLVDVTAALETPPVFETFDYREYLARRGIVSTALYPDVTLLGRGGNAIKRTLYDIHEALGRALEHSLPAPESALARGILLGERDGIPEDVNAAFTDAGLSHLIVISGYNVMLVAGAVTGALSAIAGRRQATALAMAIVVAYGAFVGWEPSVARAVLMALVMLGATLFGRPNSGLTAVALAGALLVAADPLIVEDVSFQLSFVATLGLVIFAVPLRERLASLLAQGLPGPAASFLAEQVAVTAVASFAVVPVIAATFGRLSLVSLPANVLAAPAFVFALAGAFLAAMAGAIDTSLGRATGEFAHLPLAYLVWLAGAATSLPFASVAVSGFGWPEAGLLYVVLLGCAMAVSKSALPPGTAPGLRPLRPALALAIASIAIAAYVWWGTLQPVDDDLRVTVLDVGQGDAILIEAPSGARVLVDGGPSGARLVERLGAVLAPSQRRIDLMVLTHAQDDHVTGLVEVLDRFDLGAVLWNGRPGETAAYRTWADAVAQRALPVAIAEAGQRLDLGGGVYIEVLNPQPVQLEGTEDDLNNNAIVLRLVYGDVSFLLTGDIEATAEAAILGAGLDVSATVLKVAHHGSDGATTAAFLDAVSPSIAVVSAGESNPFGHPSPTLRLRLAGIPLLRTDLNGGVAFETDGSRLWLNHERGEIGLVETGFAP